MNPVFLELEITESAMIDAMDDAIRKMRELRRLGIRISVDDFGAGYASLSYVQSLPIDSIKIDRSFIAPLDGDYRSAKSLVEGIIALAHNLKLTVGAGGALADARFDTLRARWGDVIQGFFLYQPLPARPVEPLLQPALAPVESAAVIQ